MCRCGAGRCDEESQYGALHGARDRGSATSARQRCDELPLRQGRGRLGARAPWHRGGRVEQCRCVDGDGGDRRLLRRGARRLSPHLFQVGRLALASLAPDEPRGDLRGGGPHDARAPGPRPRGGPVDRRHRGAGVAPPGPYVRVDGLRRRGFLERGAPRGGGLLQRGGVGDCIRGPARLATTALAARGHAEGAPAGHREGVHGRGGRGRPRLGRAGVGARVERHPPRPVRTRGRTSVGFAPAIR
mmetsp:Transcript_15968/g.44313  ORF Transcript_15968/g.44313 Transcript_15968/m.44313 type:complete len:244 (+) Transcript_15968:122-853(+)